MKSFEQYKPGDSDYHKRHSARVLPRLKYCEVCPEKWLLYADGRCPVCEENKKRINEIIRSQRET
jgi:hypothetical protein